MADRGHWQRMCSVVSGLGRLDADVFVATHHRFAPDIVAAGGTFVDLFETRSVEAADADSWPYPCRYVTFAATFGEAFADQLKALRPSLVVHDSFAVIGRVAARRLGIPHVAVLSGHNVAPARFLEVLAAHPRVHVSEACNQAVTRLRSECGIVDASPFSYVTNMSPWLNLYCEPPEFLEPQSRAPFEPLAFYGSLPDDAAPSPGVAVRSTTPPFPASTDHSLNVFISFGTMIWDYRREEALSALRVLSDAVARHGRMRAIISLGLAEVSDAERASIARPGVVVASYVDQRHVLAHADLFITHHGLNSTHESILHGVPMLSYPFVWDQPGLAATCQGLGLALPLASTPMAPLDPADVACAFARFEAERAPLQAALARARSWEAQVVADRPRVLAQLLDLAR